MPPAPRSTYRLQLHGCFGFRDAAALCERLAALGVSHLYLSPVLQAAPGSTHGYDVVDHTRLSAELGGEEGWRILVTSARAAGLGIVVDVVPNHMAVPVPESLNRPLWDVLAHGRAAEHAHWFDVDWDAGADRLLLPVLGAPIAEAAADLRVEDGVLRYGDHVLPLAPGTGDDGPPLATADAQHYRLAHWRVANEELNYRRFFDVTTLIGLRVEEPDVFAATHQRLLRLLADGEVDGLRIDHPDGLADPAGYLDRLAAATGGCWTVAEKILEPDEWLPDTWRCAGTTGYDALNRVLQVLVDPAGERPLTDLYASLTGEPEDFADVLEASKRLVVDRVLHAEVARLVRVFDRLRGEVVALRDVTLRGFEEALVEVLVAFPVYRAYLPAQGDGPAAQQVAEAVRVATARRPGRAAEIALVGELALQRGGPWGATGRELATRLAQTTGPVMAKGVEDTAFYRWHRLAALNEVGGDPGRFGRPLADWHAFCSRLQEQWPATQTALSTHDTKRSEDVRARLLVLAELPAEWADAVVSWRARRHFRDPNVEYLFWQTLVGAWPLTPERALRYVEKASREAKQRTSWTDPDPAYDRDLADFLRGVFADGALLADVERFVTERLLVPGRVTALSQKLLQLAMPGVPDVYQGQELWDLSLVDPDNRRPVDHPLRDRLLASLDAAPPDAAPPDAAPPDAAAPDAAAPDAAPLPALADDEEGLAKLLVTARVLRLRRDRPELFSAYRPVEAEGPAAAHAVAFDRGGAVAVATRWPVRLARHGGWRDTRLVLPPGSFRDELTGAAYDGSPPLARVLGRLPVALLVRS